MRPEKILETILKDYKSIREFARMIEIDPADVHRWRSGKRKIHPRAVINIVRLHPDLSAHDLNPTVFEEGLTFNFKE